MIFAVMAKNCCYTLLSAMMLNSWEIQTHTCARTHTHTPMCTYVFYEEYEIKCAAEKYLPMQVRPSECRAYF